MKDTSGVRWGSLLVAKTARGGEIDVLVPLRGQRPTNLGSSGQRRIC